MADVPLVELEVIRRYSLAIRQESAPAEDVLAALDASRERVIQAMGSATKTPGKKAPAKKAPVKKAPAKE